MITVKVFVSCKERSEGLGDTTYHVIPCTLNCVTVSKMAMFDIN